MSGQVGIVRGRRRALCPPCAEDSARRHRPWIYGQWLVSLVAVMAIGGAQGLGIWAWMIAVQAGAFVIGIAVHELAHALVGSMVGFRVLAISIGTGPRLVRRSGPRWAFELHLVPLGGWTKLTSVSTEAYRTRKIVTMAAGPLANVALAIGLLTVVPPVDHPPTLIRDLALLQLLLAVTNLWPRGHAIAARGQMSDGGQIVRALRMTDDEIAREIAASESAANHELARQAEGDHATIATVTAESLDADEVHVDAVVHLVALSNLGRHAEALQHAQALLQRPIGDPGVVANLANVLAWNIAVLDRVDLAEDADRGSALALEHAGWSPAFQSTRGAVLAWLGQDLDTAVGLMTTALEGLRRPTYRSQLGDKAKHEAHHAAFMALAHTRRNDLFRARASIATARRGDPRFPVIDRVDRLLMVRDMEHLVGTLWPSFRGDDASRAEEIAAIAGPQLDEILRSTSRALEQCPPIELTATLRGAGASDGTDDEVVARFRAIVDELRAARHTSRSA
jgi:hypothetical protein